MMRTRIYKRAWTGDPPPAQPPSEADVPVSWNSWLNRWLETNESFRRRVEAAGLQVSMSTASIDFVCVKCARVFRKPPAAVTPEGKGICYSCQASSYSEDLTTFAEPRITRKPTHDWGW